MGPPRVTSSPPRSHSSPIYVILALFSSSAGDEVKCFNSSASLLRLRVKLCPVGEGRGTGRSLSLSLARSEPRAPLASYFFAPFFYFALCEKFLLRRTTFLIAKMLNSRFVLIQYFLNYSS